MAFQKQSSVPGAGKPKMKGNSRKSAVIGLISAVVVICIAFAIPFIKVPVEVVGTYTEAQPNEYKEEAYAEREPYTVKTTDEVTDRKSETFYDNTLVELGRRVMLDRWGTEVYFTIDLSGKPNPVISGSWEVEDFPNAFYVTITDPGPHSVYKYKGAEHATQSDDFEFVPAYSGMYVIRFSTDYIRLSKYARLTLVLQWDETVTKTTERTEYRIVTKYHQVPVQVEKQETVTKYERVSIWGLLFK